MRYVLATMINLTEPRKIVVILTDGDPNDHLAKMALKEAADLKIEVVTLGIEDVRHPDLFPTFEIVNNVNDVAGQSIPAAGEAADQIAHPAHIPHTGPRPVDPMPKGSIVQIPAPPKVETRTDRGTSVVDLFGVLRTLGLGDQAEFYELYLVKKYNHESKDLTPGEISEQFITLSRCKRDAKMLK